jgi:uncharacterized RDD family membrane protein YckC
LQWWYENGGQRFGPISDTELHALVLQGSVKPETYVWCQEFRDWQYVKDVSSLAALISPEPPPLPRTVSDLQNATAASSITFPGNTTLPESISIAQDAYPNGNQHLGATASGGETRRAATWYRYFARQIDLVFIAIPVIVLTFGAVAFAAPPSVALRMLDPSIGLIIGMAILCLLVPLFEAVVATIFGNTPGKALFGLKVQTLSGQPLRFSDQVSRAYKVMVFGLGLYLPLISLGTAIAQYSNLKQHGTTGYDKGVRKVSEQSLSSFRQFVACSIWIFSFAILIALNVYDRYETGKLAASKSWTNPGTELTATLPAGWDSTSEKNILDQEIYLFTRPGDAVQIVFGVEDVPVGETLENYIKAFVDAVKEDMKIVPSGAISTISGHVASRHDGELNSPRARLQITFVKSGGQVWRAVVIMFGSSESRIAIDEMCEALFRTVKIEPGI